jgi:hypothetical protein
MPAPLLPLKEIFGGEYPAPEDAEGAKVRWMDRLKEDTEADQLAHYRQAAKNLLYANGRQHLAWNKKRASWDDLPVETGEARATWNLIRPILRSRTQRLLSAKVTFAASPESNSFEARDRANAAVSFFQARYRGTGMEDVFEQGLELAFSAGCAALKSFWNPALGPLKAATMMLPTQVPAGPESGLPPDDGFGNPTMVTEYVETFINRQGQPVATEAEAYHYRPGDTDTALRTIFHFRCNAEARGFRPQDGLRWLLDEEMVPLSVAKQRYPEHAQRMKAGSGGHTSALTYERMAAGSAVQKQANRATSPQAEARSGTRDDLILLREWWQLPDADYFPGGRLVVAAGEIVVYDGPFPQAVFPYVGLYDEPAPLTWRGRASVNDMLSPQDSLNRQMTAIVREMDLAGAGQYVAWDLPGLPGQITAEYGSVIKVPLRTQVSGKSLRDVFTRLDPPAAPPDRERIIQLSTQALYSVGAFHEVTQGRTPPGVDSGVAIKYLLEQEQGQLLKASRALKKAHIEWARCQLAIARWGYGEDETRWIPVDRPDLGVMLEELNGVDLPDPDTLNIELENFQPTSQADHRSDVKEGMEKGYIDPGRGLQLLDLGQGLNPLFASQTRHYARARRENLAIERGAFAVQPGLPLLDPATGGPAVDPMGQPAMSPDVLIHADGTPFLLAQDDDPQIHMLVLDEIILDDTKPWPVRQAAMLHKDEHRVGATQYTPVLPPSLAPTTPAGPAAGAPGGGGPGQQPAPPPG